MSLHHGGAPATATAPRAFAKLRHPTYPQGMQLVPAQARKPIRDLRKSLGALRKDPPQKAVHELRTRTRKVEAITAALPLAPKHCPNKLLKSLKPLRKAAGKVRDLDVFVAKVNALLRGRNQASLELLLQNLHQMRTSDANQLAEKIQQHRSKTQKRLKKFSKRVKKHCESEPLDARQAYALFDELSRWPRLTLDNLHGFRIKVKELRYMMQLVSGANPDFMKALDRTKVQIGSWHDWAELHTIASELLDVEKDQTAINQIADQENKNLKSAMRAAQNLRSRFLNTHALAELAEP